ncbi:hypothetical protein GJAV_G00098650 [Gymnothorax javanicus]|nr:hypothetical protein GJAV_G00098650 [Gymnothorax javanicus]
MVQDAVRCRLGVCKDDSENSPDSCKNGQVQIMTDFEKDVDLACQTERGHPFIFKEVNTCNPATITGTLSRISLDDEDDPKLASHQEGLNFSSLPGNIPPPNLLVQVPPLGGLKELSDQPLKKEVNVEQQHQRGAPVYLCTDSGLGWARPQEGGGGGEGDYMVLPRRTSSLKPPQEEDKPLNITVEDPPFPPPSPLALHTADSEAYPDFAAADRTNSNRTYSALKQLSALGHTHGHAHGPSHSLQFKQQPSVRQILATGASERTRTLPRNLGSTSTSTNQSGGSLERKRVRYSELDFEKVMHTRKRHSELYHELNHSTKFHTIDSLTVTRQSADPRATNMDKREKRWSISSAGGEKNSSSDKSTPDDQRSWDSFKTMTPDPSTGPSEQTDKLELHNKTWDSSCNNTADTSDGDFQTEV